MIPKDNVLRNLIEGINRSGLNTVNKTRTTKTFELSLHPYLLSGLSGWIGAVTVRAILYELGIDEHHVFKWRPENKYIQYLIMNYYAPGCMPRTLPLSKVLKAENWVAIIRRLIKEDHFIKATLGFGSGKRKNFDRTTDFEQILKEYLEEKESAGRWVMQKKLRLNKEFRIHTFGKDVLYGLTFRISGNPQLDDFDRPQEYLCRILQKLPSSLLEGTLLGWDIGLTQRGKYYVIEANFTGFHPEHRKGFQTTGYVDEPPFGSVICAWLNTYFRKKYAISIGAVEDSLITKFSFLEEFEYYLSIFKNKHMEALIKAKGRVAAAYFYLSEKTDFNIINIISYFQVANFADIYYIITMDDLRKQAEQIFKGTNVVHLHESSLFSKNQHWKLKKLDDEQRKNKCCKRALALTKASSYIIV